MTLEKLLAFATQWPTAAVVGAVVALGLGLTLSPDYDADATPWSDATFAGVATLGALAAIAVQAVIAAMRRRRRGDGDET